MADLDVAVRLKFLTQGEGKLKDAAKDIAAFGKSVNQLSGRATGRFGADLNKAWHASTKLGGSLDKSAKAAGKTATAMRSIGGGASGIDRTRAAVDRLTKSTNGPARFDLNRLGGVLEAIHERLGGVWIECADWRDFIARWDRPETLFYVDPPYYGTESYYRAAFPRTDHEALAGLLRGIKGRFILTMNDSKETRAIYREAGGRIDRAELTYTAAGGSGAKRAAEIIVRRL
jgi:DNA adenine methylase